MSFGIHTRLPFDTDYSDTNPDLTFLFDAAPEPDLDPNGKKFKNLVIYQCCRRWRRTFGTKIPPEVVFVRSSKKFM